MKKIISLFIIMVFCGLQVIAAEQTYSVWELSKMGIVANSSMTETEYRNAIDILKKVHEKTAQNIKTGSGPFYAAVIDSNGNIIAGESNSVVRDKCSCYHAEVNAIRAAQKKLGTYDLAPYNLSLYVNAEPCIMCVGAIMWSGIKTVYYSVPSKTVEQITGFDEGFKPCWLREFKKRGITVYGNIIPESGEVVLQQYVNTGKTIYKPKR